MRPLPTCERVSAPRALLFGVCLTAAVIAGCNGPSGSAQPATGPQSRAAEFAETWASLSSCKNEAATATELLQIAYDNVSSKLSGADWQVLRRVLDAQGADVHETAHRWNDISFWRASFAPSYDPFVGRVSPKWYVEFAVDTPDEGGPEFVRWISTGVRIEGKRSRAEITEIARAGDGAFMLAALAHEKIAELTAECSIVTAVEMECCIASMSMSGPAMRALTLNVKAESPDGRLSGTWILKTFPGYGATDKRGVAAIYSGGGTMSGPG